MDSATLLQKAKTSSLKSHRALAAQAGVAASTITRAQSGRLSPTVDVLARVLAACGFELELRVRRTGTPPRPHLDDLIDAWAQDDDGGLKLTWTTWRAWLDGLALHPEHIPEAIYRAPLPAGHPVVDSLLAAVAEKLADDHAMPRPSWTAVTPPAEPPFEPPSRRRRTTPPQLEERGLLIDSESLFRPAYLLDA